MHTIHPSAALRTRNRTAIQNDITETAPPSVARPADAAPRRWQRWALVCTILLAHAALIGWLFRLQTTNQALASFDMGAHVEISERLAQLIQNGQLVFYDHNWLGGWPVFQFNGFLAHLGTALASLPVAYFHPEPVQFTSQWLVFLGLVLLPFSVFHASSCLTGHSTRKPLVHSGVLAFFCGSVSVWFLLHSIPDGGVGATTILVSGDYPQLLAWHLLLLNFGFLARAIGSPSNQYHKAQLAFGLVFLVLTQPTSGVLFAFYAAFAVFFFNQIRRQLLLSYALAIGMLAFWLVPAILLMDEYTVSRATVSDTHLLDLLFGAAPSAREMAARELVSSLPGWLPHWDFGALILLALTGVWLIFFRATDHTVLMPFLVFTGMLSGLFLSFYFTNLIPFALDYQRLSGLVLVMLLPIIAALPAEMLKTASHHWVAVLSMITLALLISTHKVMTPHPMQWMPVAGQPSADDQTSEQRVLDYLNDIEAKGRIFIEWPADTAQTNSRGQLFIESELPGKAGFEAATGRFFNNAPTYMCAVLPAVSALDAATDPDFLHDYAGRCYDGNPAINNRPTRSEAEHLQRLSELGVSHYVAVSEAFVQSLQLAGAERLTSIDGYTILAGAPFTPLQHPAYEPIGYFDFTGNLPARYVSQSLYSNTNLPASVALIEMRRGRRVPSQLSRIIINGTPDADDERGQDLLAAMQDRKLLKLNFGENPQTGEIDRGFSGRYFPAHAYLSENLHSHPQFLAPIPMPDTDPAPTFEWNIDEQSFTASGLQPGQVLELKYGYHPYWTSKDAWFYRGGNGQMYMQSDQQAIVATFTNATNLQSEIGMVLSIFSFITLVYTTGLFYRRRTPQAS